LLTYFSAPPRCRTKIAYFLHFPSLLFCSLADNDQITEAAWIKIAEGVAASKTLQKLEYGARSFAYLFFCTASVQNKNCLLFTFPLPSFLQLEVHRRDHRSSVDQDRRRCCCQQIAAEARVRCSFFAVCFLIFIDRLGLEENLLTFLNFPSLLHCRLRRCGLSGAAGEAIGAALLTNKSLQNLEYGARSLRFAYFIFLHRLGAEQKLLTFYISPPLFIAAWQETTRSPKQRGSRSQKVLLPANRCRSSCTVLVLTFCFLIFLHRLGAEQN
jgi:hypothetical protein